MNEVEGVEYAGLPAFYILGILGNTAIKVYERAEQERSIRRGKAVLNILTIGTNDSAVRGDGAELSSELEYAKALRSIGENFTGDDNASMVYVGTPSYDDRYTANFRNRDVTYISERTRRYEAIAVDVYGEMGVPTIPLFDITNNETYLTTMLDKDSIHPNTNGYKWIYEKIRPEIVEMLGSIEDPKS
jgi:lysophospholipase L1-like esterase